MSKRICVVGAGAAGLTSVKACLEEGFHVVCFEKTANISGIWRYREELVEGVGRVNKWTITNTSKELNAFSDFPFPKEFPNFLDQKKMCEYFELYAKYFRLKPHIMFGHSVLNVCKSDDYDNTHRLVVQIYDRNQNIIFSEIFDGVMVCIGLEGTPRCQLFPGQHLFKGKIIHSLEMGTQSELCQYENKTACVVGNGNSGCDSAVELSNICDKTYLSFREGIWIIPRMGPKGLPLDVELVTKISSILCSLSTRYAYDRYMKTICNNRFDHNLYGIEPKMRNDCNHEYVIINDMLATRILFGKIVIKKNTIERFTENGIIFIGDKNETKCDLVVMATGYRIRFPFIDSNLFDFSDKKYLNLYKNVFPGQLSHPSLALIGCVKTNGPVMPLFEMQARWYVQLMANKCQFPSMDLMRSDILAKHSMLRQLGKESAKVSLFVNFISYIDSIADTIGVKPNLRHYFLTDFSLYRRLLFGSFLSYQYRLKGVHSWPGARSALMLSNHRVKYALNPNLTNVGKGQSC